MDAYCREPFSQVNKPSSVQHIGKNAYANTRQIALSCQDTPDILNGVPNRKVCFMRFRFLFLFLGLAALILSACEGSGNSQIIPATDRLTFLFFYTDG